MTDAKNIKQKLKMVHIVITCFALLSWAFLANVLSIIKVAV